MRKLIIFHSKQFYLLAFLNFLLKYKTKLQNSNFSGGSNIAHCINIFKKLIIFLINHTLTPPMRGN